MRIGVVLLPELDWSSDQERWVRAENYGFDHAWLYDHLAWRTLADGPWHATIPTLTAALLATTTLRIGTLVTTPNFRHPVPLAKEVMTLDVMSGGRVSLAVGAGAPGYDASVLGSPELAPAARHQRFIEFYELLDLTLSQRVTSWAGDWFEAADARMFPGPVQGPRPPLLVAANGPAGMRLAARSARAPGDGWVTMGPVDAALSDDQYWTSVAASARQMDTVVEESTRSRELVRLLYLGSRMSSVRVMDHLRDHLGRATDLGFTDVVIPWPRRDEPFRGTEALLEDVAASLPELRLV